MTGLSTQESRIDQSPETGSVTLHFSKLVEGVMERTRRGAIAGLMVLANGISSPAQAQTVPRVVGAGQEHTQILGATELPKPVTVTNGGKNTDIKGPYAVTASVSPSANASENKGEGQMVSYKDGNGIERKMSFAKLAQMQDGKEKDDIILQLGRTDKIKFKEFDLKMANQRKEVEKDGYQAANQEAEKFAEKRQAANQEGKELVTQLIGKYEQYISNIERGAKGDRKIVEEIIGSDITPEQLRARAVALLNKKGVVLAGI